MSSPRSRSASRQAGGGLPVMNEGVPFPQFGGGDLARGARGSASRSSPRASTPVGQGRASLGERRRGKLPACARRDRGRLPFLPCLRRPERRTGASPPGRAKLRPDSAYAITSAHPLRGHCGTRPGAQKRMGDVRGPGGQPEPKLPARLVPRRGIAHPNLADPTEFATLASFPLEARPGRCTESPPGEG